MSSPLPSSTPPTPPPPANRLGLGWFWGAVVVGFLLGLQGCSSENYRHLGAAPGLEMDAATREHNHNVDLRIRYDRLCGGIGLVGGPLIALLWARWFSGVLRSFWPLAWFLVCVLTSLTIAAAISLVQLSLPHPVLAIQAKGSLSIHPTVLLEDALMVGLIVGCHSTWIAGVVRVIVRARNEPQQPEAT